MPKAANIAAVPAAPSSATPTPKSFGAKFRSGFDWTLIAFHVGVWFFVEVGLMLSHHQVKDFIANFIDGELLLAQLIATAAYLVIYVALEVLFNAGGSKITLDGLAVKNIRLIHSELWKIPVFFGGALLISGLMMSFDVAIALSKSGKDIFANLSLYYHSATWLLAAAALFVLSALLNMKKI